MSSAEDRAAEDRRRAESTRDFNKALGGKNHGVVRWLLGIPPPGAADAMVKEVLCKFLCHNICCVIQAQGELGIEAEFWQDEEAPAGSADVLPMVRPG